MATTMQGTRVVRSPEAMLTSPSRVIPFAVRALMLMNELTLALIHIDFDVLLPGGEVAQMRRA